MAAERVLVIDDSPTILKVVQLVLTKAGFDVATAADGDAGLLLAREKKPALILLDFVMPKLNGYQVCRALQGDDELKQVPVVLMSAKGDQVGERFVKVMGIVDYITKPFSPDAITAVVTHTIAKYKVGGTGETEAPPLIEGSLEITGTGIDTVALREAESARRRVLAEVKDGLATTIGRALVAKGVEAPAAAEGASADPEARMIDAAAAALSDELLAEILAPVAPGMGSAPDEPVLQGDLRVVPIAEVLQLLGVQAQSGVLEVNRAKGSVDVYFRSGKVDLAVTHGVSEEFLLGRFLLEGQVIGREELDSFLANRQGSGTSSGGQGQRLLGAQLVKLGYISELDLRQAISKQTCEIVYEILRWNFGRFTFKATRELPPTAVEASLGLDIEGILMEGFRRVDEWHVIEREVDTFEVVFLRNEDAVAQMGRGRLTREELGVLELVNGKNTVKDIVRQSRLGSFDVTKMLYRLFSIKLIRRRVLPVAV